MSWVDRNWSDLQKQLTLIDAYKKATGQLALIPMTYAFADLGNILHANEDFYAHSNYVELAEVTTFDRLHDYVQPSALLFGIAS